MKNFFIQLYDLSKQNIIKSTIFILLVHILSYNIIYSQEGDPNRPKEPIDKDLLDLKKENPNFYDIMHILDKNNRGDTTEGSFYKQMKKAELFWHDRLFPTGQTLQMGAAVTDYVKKFNSGQITNCNNQFWEEKGPIGRPQNSNGVGQIHAIRCSPNYITDKVIYAASNWGGLWKRTGNNNWVKLNTDFQLPFTSVSDIAINPNNTQTIYITTGDAEMSMGHYAQNLDGGPSFRTPIFTAGVYRSTNGGASWQHINGGSTQPLLDDFIDGGTIRKILIHPTDNNTLYIATSVGVYKSINANASTPTWTKIFTPLNDSELKGLEFKPGDPNTIYVSGRDVYRSQDGGVSWASITGGTTGLDLNMLPNSFIVNRINIATQTNFPNELYAYIVGTFFNGSTRYPRLYVFKFNSGIWTQVLVQSNNDTSGFITPTRTAIVTSPLFPSSIYFGTERLWGRNSDVQNIIQISPYNSDGFHADVHALAPVPGEQKMFVGTDGGVHIKDLTQRNTSGGWTDISGGLAVKTIYRFDDSNDKIDRIMIGNQDTGTDVFMGSSWKKIEVGDGYNGKIDDKTGLAFGNWNGNLFSYNWISTNSNEHKLPNDPTQNSQSLLKGTFQMKNHPVSEKMIFSFTELYERKKHEGALLTDNASTLWDLRSDVGKIVNAQWQRQLTEFDISPSNPNYWLIGLSGNQVDSKQPVLHALDPFIVEPKLLRSTTGGCAGLAGYQSSTPCFTDITQNLISSGVSNSSYQAVNGGPSTLIPVITSVIFHPENHLRAWVTFTGYEPTAKVWFTNDGGNTWFNADPNGTLNNLPVNDIVYQKGTNDRIYIGTDAGIYYRDNSSNIWTKFCNFPNVMVTELKINYCVGKLRASTFGRGLWEGDLLSSNGTIGSDALEITSNVTWNTSRGIDRNIRIKPGGTLNITGSNTVLSLPKDGKIIIEQGGLVNVTDAKITNNCGQVWGSIEIWGNSNLSQTYANQGVLILNNATIEHGTEAVIVSKDGGTAFNGGIIQATNTKFFNNKRSVSFYKYDFQNNISIFNNCNFKTDASYRHSQSLLAHLTMWAVKGININGCNFETTNNFVWDPTRVTGIGAVDANFTVTDYCSTGTNPCTGIIKSTFNGLHKSINTQLTTGISTFNVYKSIFQNNVYGIISTGHNNFNIRANNFTVGKSSVGNTVVHEGVSIFAGTGFNVDQNTFAPTFTSSTQPVTVGIRCTDTGASDKEIYKNTFSKSTTSNTNVFYANLANGTNRNASSPIIGLKYYCNTNINNIQKGYDFAVTDIGISNSQGSLTFPARNTFSLGSITPNSDYSNSAYTGLINYYHRVGVTNEIPVNRFQVNNFNTSGTGNGCFDRYGGVAALTLPIGETYDQIKSKIYVIDQKLKDARGLGDQQHIEQLEQQLLDFNRDKYQQERDIIQYWLDKDDFEKLAFWYEKVNDLPSQMSLIDLYISKKNISKAEEKLMSFLEYISKIVDKDEELLNFFNLKSLQINAIRENRDMLVSLHKDERNLIVILAQYDKGIAGYQSRNILNFFGENYFIDPVFPVSTELRNEKNYANLSNKDNLKAYPNPASNIVNFEYKFDKDDLSNVQLKIVDFMGRPIQILSIIDPKGTISWDCTFVPSGVYYYSILNDQKMIFEPKSVIVIK